MRGAEWNRSTAERGDGHVEDPAPAQEDAARRNPNKSKSADKPGSVTGRANAPYGRHSSRRRVTATLEPPTRGLGEQPWVESFRPLTWCCSGWRLPRFTRSGHGVSQTGATRLCGPVPRLRRPLARSTYCGWALPSILLCGARTFLSPHWLHRRAATVWLTSDANGSTVSHPNCVSQRLLKRPRASASSRRRAKAQRCLLRTDTTLEQPTIRA